MHENTRFHQMCQFFIKVSMLTDILIRAKKSILFSIMLKNITNTMQLFSCEFNIRHKVYAIKIMSQNAAFGKVHLFFIKVPTRQEIIMSPKIKIILFFLKMTSKN